MIFMMPQPRPQAQPQIKQYKIIKYQINNC